MRRLAALFALLFLVPPAAQAGGVPEAPLDVRRTVGARFVRPPTATKDGTNVKIAFESSAATDAEVAVLDAKGKIVRHLAAGLLGKNAPEPFKKDSLAQEVVWDGKDDYGEFPPFTLHPPPFSARVRLGMKAAFEGFIGFDPADHNPLRLGSAADVRALATAPNGELFAFYMCTAGESYSLVLSCAVFSRDGKYLRTIMPYPANLSEEKLRGVKRVELANGKRVPYVYQHDLKFGSPGRGRALVPLASESAEGISKTLAHRAVATADGRVAFVNAPFRSSVAVTNARAVMVLNSDGGVPAGGMAGTTFDKGAVSASLALSPDGQTIYASGVQSKKGPINTVFRFGWKDKEPKAFISSGLKEPMGVAVDGAGNVYVADRGNNRVAVFKSDGALLGEVKTPRPERVEVHPGTGAVYVLGGAGINELAKFADWKAPAAKARATLPTYKHPDYTVVMALDASAEPPVLWASPCFDNARFALLRIEDRGDSFSDAVDIGKPTAAVVLSPNNVINMSYSRPGGLLNVGKHFYRPAAGGVIDAGADARRFLDNWDGGFGLDGNFYIQGGRLLIRLGPDLKPRPFPKPAKAANSPTKSGRKDDEMIARYGAIFCSGSARLRGRGVTADRDGNVFVLSEVEPNLEDPTALWKYGPEGSLAAAKLIDTEFRCVESVRLDPQGNIYVAVSVRPGRQLLPAELEGKVPADMNTPEAKKGLDYYPDLYGSIVKFGPQGGVIKKGCGGEPANYSHGGQTQLKGAQWIRLGVTGTLGFDAKPEPVHHCACQSSRIDVDSYGRVFYPDAGRFRVGMLDTAGNEIGHFGSYGNVDSAGPKSTVPVPEIPFAWPQAVAVDDQGAVYVGDRFSRRVVKVRLGAAAEASCPLP